MESNIRQPIVKNIHEIEYIYKDGKWNNNFPYKLTEGKIIPNDDGSFTFEGDIRGTILLSDLPVGKTLCVKFKPINNVNGLHLIKDNTYRAYITDDTNSTGNWFRTIGMQIDGEIKIYVAGNYYSYKIYEIFIY